MRTFNFSCYCYLLKITIKDIWKPVSGPDFEGEAQHPVTKDPLDTKANTPTKYQLAWTPAWGKHYPKQRQSSTRMEILLNKDLGPEAH